jgi:hypothetical protein
MKVNSQTCKAAMTLASRTLLTLNAIPVPKNVNHVKKEALVATLPLSVKPLVEKIMQNVIQELVNAPHVIQQPTITVFKPKMLVIKNAKLCHYQNAIKQLVNVMHAQRVQAKLDVFQMLHAKIHAQ